MTMTRRVDDQRWSDCKVLHFFS